MQTPSKKFLLIPLLALIALSGCKKKQHDTDTHESFFSKVHKKKKSGEAAPFGLDADSMKTFALDDKLSKHEGEASAASESKMFSWEDVKAEESRHQFKTIYFGFDKDEITPAEEPALAHDIAKAKDMIKTGKIIVIEGHACHSAGSRAYNLAISERRARTIARKFAEAGIDADHIKIAARGQECPVRKGGSREEQWVNRRVEIFAIDKN